MKTGKNRINFFNLDIQNYKIKNKEKVKQVVDILNKERLVIISGLKNTGKLDLIKELINITNSKYSFFYFNKSEDSQNIITDNKTLYNHLIDYIKLYKRPNIIVLENISKINGIKDFITKTYKENHKIILIGNDIKISGIKEIEIINKININDENLEKTIKYGTYQQLTELNSKNIIEKYLKLTTSDIFLHDIFKNFGVKNIELYNYTISFLGKNNIFLSLRELQKELNNIQNISLKTTIDYIDFSMQAKILKRVYKYDFKKDKEITSKAKYYFSDNGVRNSLVNFNLDKNILIENLVFNILEYNNYKIYSGTNGVFDFSFYCIKEKKEIFIHISKQSSKEELKKEVNKLNKIPKIGNKYLLIDSIEKLGIKKLKYDSVIILEINEFLKNFWK